eukprot:scaffold17.g502.t1
MAASLPSGLKDLLDSLEDVVPDEVTQYALRKAGVDCKDVRTLRLVSVAAQKFAAGVLDEAVNVAKRKRLAPAAHLRAQGMDPKDRRVVLTTEDLTEALQDYGINVNKAPYYADASKQQQQQQQQQPAGAAAGGTARR